VQSLSEIVDASKIEDDRNGEPRLEKKKKSHRHHHHHHRKSGKERVNSVLPMNVPSNEINESSSSLPRIKTVGEKGWGV